MSRAIRCFIVALCPIVLHVGQARAQTTLSVRGGGSIANLGGSDIDSYINDVNSRTGFNLGGALTLAVAENMGIQIGAAFVQKGATATEEGVDITLSLDYIEVPLLWRLSVPTEGAVSPHFYAGPGVSFQADCKVKGSMQGVSASVDCGAADLPIKSIDVGALLGAGVDIPASGAVAVTLDVFYNLGLSSIDDSGFDSDVKNRAWSILAGASFPIG